MTGASPSCCAAVGGVVFLGGVKPSGLNIFVVLSIRVPTRPNLTWRRSPLSRACLSDIKVIMVIMRVHLVESLYQAAMGWIPCYTKKSDVVTKTNPRRVFPGYFIGRVDRTDKRLALAKPQEELERSYPAR
jgi:hypothetical protein